MMPDPQSCSQPRSQDGSPCLSATGSVLRSAEGCSAAQTEQCLRCRHSAAVQKRCGDTRAKGCFANGTAIRGSPADAPSADRVGETPAACLLPAVALQYGADGIGSFATGAGSGPGTLATSATYERNWSLAERTSSAPITAMKSGPFRPNSSFARSQGSCLKGAGNRRWLAGSTWRSCGGFPKVVLR
jgi:hypothetical protein